MPFFKLPPQKNHFSDHTPSSLEQPIIATEQSSEYLTVTAKQLRSKISEAVSSNLKRLRPLLDLPKCFGERYREAGEWLLKLKTEVGHGNYCKAAKLLGYERQTRNNCTNIFMSGKTGDELEGPIAEILSSIKEGRVKVQADELTARIEANRDKLTYSKIILGDSFEWLKSQPDDSVPFFVTDPPFGIGLQYEEWQESASPEEHYKWILPYWKEMQRCLKPGGIMILFQFHKYVKYFHDWFSGCQIDTLPKNYKGLMVSDLLVRWTKPTGLIIKRKFSDNMPTWVPPVIGRHDSYKYFALHPCPKNLREVEAIILHYTDEESLVIDPFCGTGATPAACKKWNRKFIGIERELKYFHISQLRVKEQKLATTQEKQKQLKINTEIQHTDIQESDTI